MMERFSSGKIQGGILAALALIVMLIWPVFGSFGGISVRIIGMAFLYGALAASWNLFALTGTISLGHAAFFGLGAYGSAIACKSWGLSPYFTIFMGGIVGAAYGLILHLTLGRMRGARYALASLASVEIPKAVADNWDGLTHGTLGIVGIPPLPSLHFGSISSMTGESIVAQYYVLLILFLLTGFIHAAVLLSKAGLAMQAVREEETAASSIGINIDAARCSALTASAFLTALCGGVYAHLIGLIEPSIVFHLHFSIIPLILSIFGGRYSSFGPLLGAMVLYPADQLLFHTWLPLGHSALYGIIVVAAMLFFPHGICSIIQRGKYART
jgi:branched-chain amino acid transport system permease protein